MPVIRVYDYLCSNGHETELFVDFNDKDAYQLCKICGEVANRMPSAPALDWKMGADPDFTTMGDKFVRMHEEGAKRKEHD
jgi:hypothetical protein